MAVMAEPAASATVRRLTSISRLHKPAARPQLFDFYSILDAATWLRMKLTRGARKSHLQISMAK
jgi:hypothetical protein